MAIDGQGSIVFWGDERALSGLFDALKASIKNRDALVFSIPLDLFRVYRPVSLVAVISPEPHTYGSTYVPPYMKHLGSVEGIGRRHYSDEYYLNGEKIGYEGNSVALSLRGQFPGIFDLVAFCETRKNLFSENINFKIMYLDPNEDMCVEATYAGGQLVKNESMSAWDAADEILCGCGDSGKGYFSDEMWAYLRNWLHGYVSAIEAGRDEDEDED
jgi:hypothetical protein